MLDLKYSAFPQFFHVTIFYSHQKTEEKINILIPFKIYMVFGYVD